MKESRLGCLAGTLPCTAPPAAGGVGDVAAALAVLLACEPVRSQTLAIRLACSVASSP
jgi:hypothetical protein